MKNTENNDSGKKGSTDDDSVEIYEVDIVLDEELSYTEGPHDEKTAGYGTPAENPSDTQQEPAGEVSPGEAPGTSTSNEAVLSEIREISRRVGHLADHFDGKLKYDEHKNKIIDELHGQLQDFREGIIKKHLVSIVSDLIKIIDDTRKFKSHYETGHRPEDTTERLLDFIGQISSDLEDLFTFQGIFPYTCPGNQYDSVRQRIIRKIPTEDPEKNRLVAESLRPGYEWEGKVIRPEMVAVYIFNDQPNGETIES